jgi:hypothetical protein
MRNLSQRERNRLAKAGEADRAIKTKMVGYIFFDPCSLLTTCTSQNISSLASGRVAKPTADDWLSVLLLLLDVCCVSRYLFSSLPYLHVPDPCATICHLISLLSTFNPVAIQHRPYHAPPAGGARCRTGPPCASLRLSRFQLKPRLHTIC